MDTAIPWCCLWSVLFALLKSALKAGGENYRLCQLKGRNVGLGLSSTSVNRAFATIKSFFSWLSRAYPETLQHNPTLAVSLEKVPLPPRDLSEVELTAMFDALLKRGDTHIRDTALLLVLSHGLRAGEVCGLNVGDFDSVRLTIKKAKDDSTGTVPLNRLAREQLTAYLEWRRNQEGNLLQDCPLFVSLGRNKGGERLGYKGIYNVVKELGEAAGIKDLTPHRLRHTYATNLLLKGLQNLSKHG